MSKMIQVRNVPDDIHRVLKTRAAEAGMTLSDFLLRELAHIARRPTLEEVVRRIRGRRPARPAEGSAAAVRAERGSRR